MNERAAVKMVAKLAPWLAPVPSAYFVARAGMAHLGLPLSVAVIAAAIIETLGLATVHTGLWLSDYNGSKRKSDPEAPTWMAVGLGAVYLVATVGLVVVLEVWPALATYAPALFPALAVVGAFNLALIAQQERREAGVQASKERVRESRRLSRQKKRSRQQSRHPHPQPLSPWERGGPSRQSKSGRPESRNVSKKSEILDIFRDSPEARPAAVAEAVGIGRSTVYQYLKELQAAGAISRNGHGVEVHDADALS